MRTIRREFFNVANGAEFRIVPLGDIHLGAAGCDEKLLAAKVKEIAEDPDCYWIGMGDYCEFINRSDRRFDPLTVADWIHVRHLADLPGAQLERILRYLSPIADKCLGLLDGNHEFVIRAKYERDIYSDIVTGIKKAGGFPADYRLALGYEGFLRLVFYWGADRKHGSRQIDIALHHGWTNGRLEGGKALNMQRWLWFLWVDLALCGHSHNTQTQAQDGLALAKNGQPEYKVKKGAFTGTFLGVPIEADTYATRRGYFHAPVGTILVTLRPGAKRQPDRVLVTA